MLAFRHWKRKSRRASVNLHTYILAADLYPRVIFANFGYAAKKVDGYLSEGEDMRYEREVLMEIRALKKMDGGWKAAS